MKDKQWLLIKSCHASFNHGELPWPAAIAEAFARVFFHVGKITAKDLICFDHCLHNCFCHRRKQITPWLKLLIWLKHSKITMQFVKMKNCCKLLTEDELEISSAQTNQSIYLNWSKRMNRIDLNKKKITNA